MLDQTEYLIGSPGSLILTKMITSVLDHSINLFELKEKSDSPPSKIKLTKELLVIKHTLHGGEWT